MRNKPEATPEDLGICSRCGEELKPIYENNGFTAPDPEHWEIVGFEPCPCRDDDGEGEDNE